MTPPPPELVVFSHLRWSWVWQRPQHLISRFAAEHRTWFVEEPRTGDVDSPTLEWEDAGPVTVVRLVVPEEPGRGHIGFDCRELPAMAHQLRAAVGGWAPMAWLYTPLALPLARALSPEVIVYDVMDDLASFKGASPLLREAQVATLGCADVVFCGGRSLHQAVSTVRPDRTYLFASGVETEHYARSRDLHEFSDRPVAGWVGVIDERLDLDLVAGLAEALPDWELRMVGPVTKIDPASLPSHDNITWAGPAPYRDLPEVMAAFDVALMPFALNEATRSISPTKTLEYLAAGLPVVSTPVPDVVADYANVVHLCDDAAGFAAACEHLRNRRGHVDHDAHTRPVLEWHHWDRIAERMGGLIRSVRMPLEQTA